MFYFIRNDYIATKIYFFKIVKAYDIHISKGNEVVGTQKGI